MNNSITNFRFKKRRMKKMVCIVIMVLFLVGGTVLAEEAPQAVVAFVESQLVALGSDPVIVEAVKAENAMGKSLDRIKEMDDKWKNTPEIAEIFVMDNRGANVAMTEKTSDYWQGDEAKFQKSYDDGRGAVFIDEVEFDTSTQAYLVQASFPVKDGGTVIGAITVGIDIDAFEEMKGGGRLRSTQNSASALRRCCFLPPRSGSSAFWV